MSYSTNESTEEMAADKGTNYAICVASNATSKAVLASMSIEQAANKISTLEQELTIWKNKYAQLCHSAMEEKRTNQALFIEIENLKNAHQRHLKTQQQLTEEQQKKAFEEQAREIRKESEQWAATLQEEKRTIFESLQKELAQCRAEQKSNENMAEELKNSQLQCNSLQKVNEELQKLLQQQEQIITQSMQRNVTQRAITDSQQKNEQLLQELSKVQKQLESLEQKRIQSETENAQLRHKVLLEGERNQQIVQLRLDNDSLQEEKANQLASINNLKENLRQLNDKYVSIKQEHNEMLEKMTILQQENANLHKNYYLISQEKEEILQKLQNFSSDREIQANSQKISQIKTLTETNVQLNQQLSELKKELEIFQRKDQSAEMAQLKHKQEFLAIEGEKNRQELKQYCEEIHSLQLCNEQLREGAGELLEKNERQEALVAELGNTIVQLEEWGRRQLQSMREVEAKCQRAEAKSRRRKQSLSEMKGIIEEKSRVVREFDAQLKKIQHNEEKLLSRLHREESEKRHALEVLAKHKELLEVNRSEIASLREKIRRAHEENLEIRQRSDRRSNSTTYHSPHHQMEDIFATNKIFREIFPQNIQKSVTPTAVKNCTAFKQ